MAISAAPGELVAVDLPPGPRWLDVVAELWDRGVAFLPLDRRLTERERRDVLDRAAPALVLSDDEKTWFADGRPYRVFHFLRGQEQGEQRMWYADGTPRAAYVVRDGRRYGVLGSKGCTGERNGGGG